MNSLLMEQLNNSGLLKGDTPNVAAVERLNRKKILDLLHESAELTSLGEVVREQSIFSQATTLSLSGGRRPCSGLDCRARNAKNLAQYAALYADKIYIHNFLLDHIFGHEVLDEQELKSTLVDDLTILAYLKPLIEAGRVVPMTPPDEYCPTCFGTKLKAEKQRRREKTVFRWLYEKYLKETEVEVRRISDDRFVFGVHGPDLLLTHGGNHITRKSLPEALLKNGPLMARIQAGEGVKLSRTMTNKAKLHERFVSDVLKNIMFDLACCQCLGTTFLTERVMHIDVLNKFTADTELTKRNHAIQKHLTALLPFVSSVRTADLLILREKEADAFLSFRHGLTKAVDEFRKNRNGRFNAQDASQLYGDVIEPALARIDRSMLAAKRKLLKGSAAKTVGWIGAISFGFYSGFLPNDLAQAAAVLGLTQILTDLSTPVVRSALAGNEVIDSDMYFLWRVREEQERNFG
jgi:hypothetical protein